MPPSGCRGRAVPSRSLSSRGGCDRTTVALEFSPCEPGPRGGVLGWSFLTACPEQPGGSPPLRLGAWRQGMGTGDAQPPPVQVACNLFLVARKAAVMPLAGREKGRAGYVRGPSGLL